MRAVYSDDVEAVKSMLAAGAKVDQSDVAYGHYRAMVVAEAGNRMEMARLLLDHGAEIDDEILRTAKLRSPAMYELIKETAAKRAKQMAAPLAEAPKATQDNLALAISANSCEAVRAIFDEAFWAGHKIIPTWEHLKEAVLRENKDMIRLLVARGATATDENATEFNRSNKHLLYVQLLRSAGIRIKLLPLEEENFSSPADKTGEETAPVEVGARKTVLQKEKIPAEWKTVLKALQEGGAPDAIIAGGALRDLVNEKPVKDVDIFLRHPATEFALHASEGETGKKMFLQNCFGAVNLVIEQQVTGSTQDYYGKEIPLRDQFPAPRTVEPKKGTMNGWKVIAGPEKTTYNIIFVESGTPAEFKGEAFKTAVLNSFDFGFCQAAFDGKDILTTKYFECDIAAKRITRISQNPTTPERLARMVEKYPDWSLCTEQGDVYEIGRNMPGKGIFIGAQNIENESGEHLGIFNVFAAPTDLTDSSGERLRLKFKEAAQKVGQLKNWHGHDGIPTKGDYGAVSKMLGVPEDRYSEDFYAILKAKKYKGQWFIPTGDILREDLYPNRDRGDLKGSFAVAAAKDSPYTDWYWSSTKKGLAVTGTFLHVCPLSSKLEGQPQEAHSSSRLNCRPVRLELLCKGNPKPPTGNRGTM